MIYEDAINVLMQEELRQPLTEYSRGRFNGLLAAKRAVHDAEIELERRVWDAWVAEGVEPR